MRNAFRWHTRNTDPVLLNLHRGTRDMLKLALDAAMPLIENQRENRAHGLVGEFGVGSGKSMRMTQEILPLDIEMHGFDTLYVITGRFLSCRVVSCGRSASFHVSCILQILNIFVCFTFHIVAPDFHMHGVPNRQAPTPLEVSFHRLHPTSIFTRVCSAIRFLPFWIVSVTKPILPMPTLIAICTRAP